jgi:Ca-activated chloride channel homolog
VNLKAPSFAALLALTAPFTVEQPRVREGNEKLRSGDSAGALDRYDAAEHEAGSRPEIDYDRGEALYAAGRHAEAREAYERAVSGDRAGRLASRALQNMGNALDASGDREGAVRAFSEALERDPSNEDARYNLEVLLRRTSGGQGAKQEERSGGAKQPPTPSESKPGDASRDEKSPGSNGTRPEPGSSAKAPKPGEDQEPGPTPGASPPRRPGERHAEGEAGTKRERERPGPEGDAGGSADGLAKQDAERLLDALRSRERNMPLGPAGRREARRKDVERDW